MIDISALDRATDSDEGNDHTCAFVVEHMRRRRYGDSVDGIYDLTLVLAHARSTKDQSLRVIAMSIRHMDSGLAVLDQPRVNHRRSRLGFFLLDNVRRQQHHVVSAADKLDSQSEITQVNVTR